MHRTQNPTAPAADTADPSVVTPADILRGAARYLDQHGWYRTAYYGGAEDNPFPPADVVGAIAMAAYGKRHDDIYTPHAPDADIRAFRRAVDTFCDYLSRYEPMCRLTGDEDVDLDLELSPFIWNDDPQRTALHATLALLHAAKDWDRSHGGAR
jgi:hypothetical protein